MNKKRLFYIGLFLSIALLVGMFLIVPNVTHASAPKVLITVTQVEQCAQLVSLYDTQTCVMEVSIQQNLSQVIHFNVSSSAVSCYAGTCSKLSPASRYVQVVEPSSNSLQSANQQVPILIIAPLDIEGASMTFTFVVSGPSNNVTRQLSTSSED